MDSLNASDMDIQRRLGVLRGSNKSFEFKIPLGSEEKSHLLSGVDHSHSVANLIVACFFGFFKQVAQTFLNSRYRTIQKPLGRFSTRLPSVVLLIVAGNPHSLFSQQGLVSNNCGLNCLSGIFSIEELDAKPFEKKYGPYLTERLSFLDLHFELAKNGLYSEAFKNVSWDGLRDRVSGEFSYAIVQTIEGGSEHFVLVGMKDGRTWVFDYPHGVAWFNKEDFNKGGTRNVIFVSSLNAEPSRKVNLIKKSSQYKDWIESSLSPFSIEEIGQDGRDWYESRSFVFDDAAVVDIRNLETENDVLEVRITVKNTSAKPILGL